MDLMVQHIRKMIRSSEYGLSTADSGRTAHRCWCFRTEHLRVARSISGRQRWQTKRPARWCLGTASAHDARSV